MPRWTRHWAFDLTLLIAVVVVSYFFGDLISTVKFLVGMAIAYAVATVIRWSRDWTPD